MTLYSCFLTMPGVRVSMMQFTVDVADLAVSRYQFLQWGAKHVHVYPRRAV